MAQPAPIEQSVLLVIDIQDSFKLGSRWERRNNPGFEQNVDRLLQSWRAAGLPVFFILHTDPDPGFERDSPLVKVMDFLSPRENEPVILKDTRNAFTSTDLQKRLDAKGVHRVVITGISTEQCCETTTRVAADLGYDVDFVTEATATFPIALPDGGELSTDEVVRRTEAVLRNRFARIARVEELVEELEKAALPCNG
jgi:nicotinamidase-related amidase